LEHLILPALTLSTIPWRFWLELLAALCWKYYHKTTSAPQGKGLLERWVIFKHAENALLPVVTIIGLQFGTPGWSHSQKLSSPGLELACGFTKGFCPTTR